ncbi:MAG: hypothetical protein E7612_05840 [Ruminococcaceae bacterium]|nr:hypothetical protein [Oscillospiraceae bacterium]
MKSKKAIYDCLVIGHLKREVPICFISESEGYFRLRLGTAKHNITIQKHFVYSTPGNGKKIMIINPTPKYAYICDLGEEQEKRIYNAEKVWDYVAYEAEAFIGALDRGCLGNYSSAVDKNDPKIPKLRQHPIDV